MGVARPSACGETNARTRGPFLHRFTAAIIRSQPLVRSLLGPMVCERMGPRVIDCTTAT